MARNPDATSSPTRTRTLNLAVNSRSLYRLSYRGIRPSSIPVRVGPLKGTRRRRRHAERLGRNGPGRWACDRRSGVRPPRPRRARLDVKLSASRLIPCAYRLLVLLDRLLEDVRRSAHSATLCLPWPNSPTARAAREACESENEPRFQAWKHLLNSRRDPDQESVSRVPSPSSVLQRANRGMHWYCTRNSAGTFIIFFEMLRFEPGKIVSNSIAPPQSGNTIPERTIRLHHR